MVATIDRTDTYTAFLDSKRLVAAPAGLEVDESLLPAALFDFQRDIVRWALRRGRAAVFAGTGLGKTPIQLSWADAVHRQAGVDVLILAPLAVAQQTVREGVKFGIAVNHCQDGAEVQPGITITNYERMHRFDTSMFGAVVLDESSIIKSYDGKMRTTIIDAFGRTPYRLACTATPAPNDYMELGNHAEFLGVMTRIEMLASFFVHDGGTTQDWRLKGHAESAFWQWMCSWSVMLRHPADLGYDGTAFNLPPLNMHSHIVESEAPEGMLFAVEALALLERRQARKASLSERVAAAAAIVNAEPDQPWLVWTDLNAESVALTKAIPGAVEVTGSQPVEVKERLLEDFSAGRVRVLVSKSSIAGFGMNWQHCARVAFVGLSDSWEQYYQAIRRCWRFGQTRAVECHVISSTAEGAVVANIERKERDADRMTREMVTHMADLTSQELQATSRMTDTYARDVASGDGWTAHLGDCVDVMREMADGSVDFSVYSPPFASLYTYSNSPRDMGNVRTHAEFYEHFSYAVRELFRILKPGRLMSVHCMNLPTSKVRDGYIGIADFRGDLIRMFQDAGFIFHSEVVIWKDPVTAMQRTKALGLLYKQLRKDSAMSRQGIPDYLVTMRKPGENPDPVTKTHESFPVDLWQRYASPVWFDINPSETLQRESAREEKDERHIAPLQLEVIRRAVELWTNPGDLVFDPYTGIGSSGYVALQEGRRFAGAELKRSYWDQAVANLTAAARRDEQPDLFSIMAEAAV